MDVCIKTIVVTIAILNTVRSHHGHNFDRHHEYDYHDHNHGFNEHSHGDWNHGCSSESYEGSSTEYESMSKGVSHPPHFDHHKMDFKGHGAQYWHDNSRDSKEDSGSWEDSSMNTKPGKDNGFIMPRSPINMNTRRPPQAASPSVLPVTTSSPLTTLICMRSCQVTSEYNPVCGTNNITYNNPGRLECAQYCGVDVKLQRPLPCSRPAPADTTATSTPATSNTTPEAVAPTRYTTVDVKPGTPAGPIFPPPIDNNNGVTVPQIILDNIFKPTSDPSEDIDIRDRKELN